MVTAKSRAAINAAARDVLKPHDREIARLRLVERLTLQEVGKRYGVGRTRREHLSHQECATRKAREDAERKRAVEVARDAERRAIDKTRLAARDPHECRRLAESRPGSPDRRTDRRR